MQKLHDDDRLILGWLKCLLNTVFFQFDFHYPN